MRFPFAHIIGPEPTGGKCQDPTGIGCEANVEPPGTVCDACIAAWELAEAKAGGYARPDENALRMRSGVPDGYWEYSWAECRFPDDRTKSLLREAVTAGFRRNGGPPVLMIWGSVGAGKTGFAACLALDRIKRRLPVRWYDTDRWIRKVTTSDDLSEREQLLEDTCRYRGLLVLDEFIPRHVTDHARDRMYSVINERTAHCRELALTTNYPLAGADLSISEVWGLKIASRIGQGYVVEWQGEDGRA